MRKILTTEIQKEKCNAAALGMFNAGAETLSSTGNKDPYQKVYNDFNDFESFFENDSKNRKEIDSVFHTARNLLTDIQQKSMKDSEMKKLVEKYLNGNKSTLTLKEILSKVDRYNDNNLTHFNAFSRIDSTMAIYRQEKRKKK
ncbi:hypothetical protein PF438_04150 [Elizabethkingia meningoseptica]|uniref:hypothetical protein n=1 Tax=Elizabethkingia meningoseptica TaxID=238 RepID=UPI0022F18691|nr:hypothetical protein [Elizabethkingia meningoseptica]EJK5330534.1 hypothetical protein [Elizabethkingia meningoseptica]WBS75684.1 hypothetical protein PF438_04150 [Elizabethkingia meningoseptica]